VYLLLVILLGRIVAIVVFQIVNSPCSERGSFNVLVLETSGITSAAINSYFEPEGMEFIAGSIWERYRAGDDLVGVGATANLDGPAIIN
jgi:hypothetical protein